MMYHSEDIFYAMEVVFFGLQDTIKRANGLQNWVLWLKNTLG